MSENEKTEAAGIRPETVESELDTVQKLSESEELRGQSFNQRAAWLLGFVGVVLTLTVGQAREVVSTDLGSVGEPVSVGLLAIAAVLLLWAAKLAIDVLKPQDIWHIEREEVERYASRVYVSEERPLVEGRTMRGLIRQFSEEREANNTKSEVFEQSARRLLWSFGFLAAQWLSSSWWR
jgi:hypothetical protein